MLAMKEFAYVHQSGELPELLRDIPFLKSFSKHYQDDILFSSCLVECEPGETIITEGQDDARIYILLKGEIDVIKGGEVVAKISKSGEVFGEMALLGSEKRSASVVAKTRLICLAIDQRFLNEIESVTEDAPYYAAFYGFLCRVLAQRLSVATSELAHAEKKLEHLKAKG